MPAGITRTQRVDINSPGFPFGGLDEIANYLEDDWGDNSLTSRSSTEDGVYPHPDANEAGDVLIGRYRPEWLQDETNGLSVTNSRLEWTQGSGDTTLIVESGFAIGEWKITYGAISISNDYDSVYLDCIRNNFSGRRVGQTNSGSGWTINIAENEVRAEKVVDGSVTIEITAGSSGVLDDTNQHTSKLTRDPYGNFELISDGASKGTTTDTFLPDVVGSGVSFGDSGGGGKYYVTDMVVQ